MYPFADFGFDFLNGVLIYLVKFSPGKITQKSEISYHQTALHWGRGLQYRSLCPFKEKFS